MRCSGCSTSGCVFGGDASHLSLVSSGATRLASLPADELHDRLAARGDGAGAAQSARAPRWCAATVVREQHATFSLAPGQPARPGAATLVAGSTWPATGSTPACPERSRVRSSADTRRRIEYRVERRAKTAVELRRAEVTSAFMKSIVVHYQEIALKGKNRPWFVARLVRNLRAATADLDVADSAGADGPDRDRARRRLRLGRRPRSSVASLRHRQLRAGRARAARSRRDRRRRSSRDLGPREPAIVPRLGAPRRQAVSADRRRRSSARSAAGSRRREDGRSISTTRSSRFTSRCCPTRRSISSARNAAPAGMPVGVGGRVACLLSGGIDSPVAAWRLMRRGCRVHVHPLSQLPDPVARLAGKDARAREAARTVPAPLAAVPGAVRRDPAAGRARRRAARCGSSSTVGS